MKTNHRLFDWIVMPCALLIAGCANMAGIYTTGDAPGDPHGEVHALSYYVPADIAHVKLIFLHGVGDHCPGYALSEDKDAWLNSRNAQRIGLTSLGSPHQGANIYSNEFLPASKDGPLPFDDQSYVATRSQHFRYLDKPVDVEAIEITWSPLTQWIKNNQLMDDFTHPGQMYCAKNSVQPVTIDAPPAQPPSRVVINRVLKEGVLDRNLADAAIYMGEYHPAMQLGVADALCRALTNQPALPPRADGRANARCDWRNHTVDDHTRFIFVTHSLGSRLVYDTLLGLMKRDAPGVDAALFARQFPGSDQFVGGVMRNTPVIYMMANQLAFLGMANITPAAQSHMPFGDRAFALPIAIPGLGGGQALAGLVAPSGSGPAPCNNVLCRLGEAKLSVTGETLSKDVAASEQLDVIAFSDTDDLLSWSIPKWYARPVPADDAGQSGVSKPLPLTFVNVYVRNAVRWFDLAEWPLTAHANYFTNRAVLDVIRCGGSKRDISADCPRP